MDILVDISFSKWANSVFSISNIFFNKTLWMKLSGVQKCSLLNSEVGTLVCVLPILRKVQHYNPTSLSLLFMVKQFLFMI